MIPVLSEDFRPARLLILDDSAFDRARLRRVINVARIHCSMVETSSLAEMDVALRSDEFDIAILDYDLPDGTGYDALRRIKDCQQNSQVISIMVTGNDAPHVAKLALNSGCSSFFLKSDLRPNTFGQAVSAGLRRKSDSNKTGASFRSRLAPVTSDQPIN